MVEQKCQNDAESLVKYQELKVLSCFLESFDLSVLSKLETRAENG